MSKYSQKRTSKSGTFYVSRGTVLLRERAFSAPSEQWVSRAPVNKFEGMSDHVEAVPPVFIRGYKLRG